ncbi:MAG: hypothetical protein U0N62_10605 [Hydrogeniiclostridium sp.]
MPLDNENVQVLQQKREQRRQEIQNQTYLGRQQQQWQQERDVLTQRAEEVNSRLEQGIPVQWKQVNGVMTLERRKAGYSERKALQNEKSLLEAKQETREQLRRRRSSLSDTAARLGLAPEGADQEAMEKKLLSKERKHLQASLADIKAREKYMLFQAGTKQAKLWAQAQCQQERVDAAAHYALMMPVGSVERRRAMAVKENEQIKLNKLNKKLKMEKMPQGPERENAEKTFARHEKFDAMKKLVGAFKKANPLSREEAVYRDEQDDKTYVNKGRAFFGGTKPMYIFEDSQGQEFLYKEAINCVGFEKTQGALVTEAASKLQQKLCGDDHSIPASAVRVNGKIVGSLQKKVDSWREGDPGLPPPDLFKWQQDPDETLNADTPQMEEIRTGLLREHVLDWLLCNFDTKGENFLFDRRGNLVSFDKEASFSHLSDKDAQDMSYDYVPHSNDTIYNVIFRRYAQGLQKLDLTKTEQFVEQVESMSEQEYMEQFLPMLEEKYGRDTRKYHENYQKILDRKTQLREKYRAFYQKLLDERRENLRKLGKADDTQDARNSDFLR